MKKLGFWVRFRVHFLVSFGILSSKFDIVLFKNKCFLLDMCSFYTVSNFDLEKIFLQKGSEPIKNSTWEVHVCPGIF